ncbi:MAG: hypothetical protein R2734_17745 [Nocardioides sp.]
MHRAPAGLADEVDGEPGLRPSCRAGALARLQPLAEQVPQRADLGGGTEGADGGDPGGGVPQGLGAGVVGVAEVRPVRRQRGAAAGHHERVDRGEREQPVAEHRVPVRRAGDRA